MLKTISIFRTWTPSRYIPPAPPPAANPFQVFPDNYISTSKKGSILLVLCSTWRLIFYLLHTFLDFVQRLACFAMRRQKKYGNADYSFSCRVFLNVQRAIVYQKVLKKYSSLPSGSLNEDFWLIMTTPSRTTIARSDDQFSKHVNGCILGVKLFYKHSFGKKLFFF